MQSEEYRYALSLGGRAVGEQHWSVTPDKYHWITRLQTDFSSGFLGGGRQIQVSRMHPKSRVSAHYLETGEGGGRGRTHFETTFDRSSGLVTLTQKGQGSSNGSSVGGRDEAQVPMVQDYQDPLSLLHLLRDLGDEVKWLEVPMVGNAAHVQRLPDSTLEHAGFTLEVRGFLLRPGRSVVYIEQHAPHRILRLLQPLEAGQILEARLLEPKASATSREGSGRERTRSSGPDLTRPEGKGADKGRGRRRGR